MNTRTRPTFGAALRWVKRSPRLALSVAVIAVLLLTMVGVFAFHNAHQVAAATGSLSLSPTSGPPGTRISLIGSGFNPGEKVETIWNYTGPKTGVIQKSFYEYNPVVNADATGAVTTTFWVSTAASKLYTVALQGLTSGTVATATYQLTPSLDLGAYVGPAGTTLRLTGWAFAAKEPIQVYWNYQQSGQITAAKASTDSKGDWSGKTFVVPSGTPAGTYPVAAVGTTSHLVAIGQYTVGAAPSGAAPGPNDWATFGYDQQDTRVNTAETTITAANVGTLGPKWVQPSPVQPYFKTVGSPVTANGIVYYGTIEGQVLAYNASTGAPTWTFNATAPIYGSPTIANGLLYFGTVKNTSEDTTGNYFYALNAATGALVWENFLTLGSDWVPPTVYNGVVYVQSALKEGAAGGFYAFNALTGATVWSQATPSGDWSVPILDPTGANMYYSTGNPCLSNPPPPQNTPQTDGCSGSIYDINPTNGATVWSYHFPDYTGDDDAPATPVYAVVNGTPEVFEGVKNGIFYAFNATTGALLWQHDTGERGDNGIYSSAAYDNDVLYFGSYESVLALNASDGSVVWSVAPTGRVVSSPAIANGIVFVTTESGYIEAYDATTGSRLWKYVIAGQTIYSSPIISNGAVYVPVSNGNLYAFTPGGA